MSRMGGRASPEPSLTRGSFRDLGEAPVFPHFAKPPGRPLPLRSDQTAAPRCSDSLIPSPSCEMAVTALGPPGNAHLGTGGSSGQVHFQRSGVTLAALRWSPPSSDQVQGAQNHQGTVDEGK